MMKLTTYKIFKNTAQKLRCFSKRKCKQQSLFYTLPFTILVMLAVYSCKSTDSLTKPLFMQSKRANLEMPPNLSEAGGILGESVTYKNEDNSSEVIFKKDSIEKAKRSINEIQHLNEVTVIAKIKQKFAPERDGKVNVDFIIRIPKELGSPNWRLSLYPKLLHNDSIVKLKEVILKGDRFLEKQKADYQAYADYEASIIPGWAYDSLFLDRKGISRDMLKRQEHYWQIYNKEFKKVMAYFQWKNKMQERYNFYNLQMESKRLNLYYSYMRKSQEESIHLLVAGIDTTGVHAKYNRKFEKKAKLYAQYHLQRELTLKKMPKKYRDFFLNEPDPEAIGNHTTTERDSIQISANRYFFDQIAENEVKDKHRDAVKKQMIPFPYEEGIQLDSIADKGQDIVYYYHQEYAVTPGLKRIRIAMDGKVTAMDHSGYTLPKSDTLHYFISSLAQLVDTSLIVKKTKLHRNMFDRMTIYPQFEANKSNFLVNFKNNRQEVDTLISRYRKLTVEMGLQMDSLEIRSWASLDGTYDNNHKLSATRAEALSEYLQSNNSSLIGANTIKVTPKGEDWQGMVNELRKRDDIVNTDSILAMVSRTVYPDQTEQEIAKLYRNDYRIIRDSVYPKLRRMDITFNISRPGMTASDSVQVQVKDGYEEAIGLLQDREYWKALEILKDYPDYNTALCLACMGYNGKAYDLLVKLPQAANTEYLLAIVTSRMEKQEEAVEHLLKSIELDPAKAYRIELDSEMIELVAKYNLRPRIEQLQHLSNDTQKEQEATTVQEQTEESGTQEETEEQETDE